jgi:hypothetical protein
MFLPESFGQSIRKLYIAYRNEMRAICEVLG